MRQPAVIDSGYGTLRPFGFASLLFNRFAFISDFLNIYSIIIVFSPANVNRFWHVFHFCYIFPSYFPWCHSADVCLCKMHGKCRKNARLRRFFFLRQWRSNRHSVSPSMTSYGKIHSSSASIFSLTSDSSVVSFSCPASIHSNRRFTAAFAISSTAFETVARRGIT